jgi:hypothetical protein
LFDYDINIVIQAVGVWCKVKKGSKMSKKQTIQVIATCESEQTAKELSKKFKNFDGVASIKVVGAVITFICKIATEFALVMYGRIKDALPWDCTCSCRPVK